MTAPFRRSFRPLGSEVITYQAVRLTGATSMRLQSQALPNKTVWLNGDLFNDGASAANRVKAILAGCIVAPGMREPEPTRIGSLVRGETPRKMAFRYDDLSLLRYPNGMEHILVEYCDEAGQRYEQRGKLLAHKDVTGLYSYTFEGLGPPTPIDLFTLRLQGLEMS